ncbi:molybdopterin converting factor subunit 1 [Psychromonas ossibalaenae]|uniref:molybdopterin converting factor subunit 1 n=1 Tax=Psychromonas ossibalaenae TaxID=444922 RepID=UPI00035F2BA1|nr:molybdopterin converting factor subunit 1 [Psychromonas ossibalaenae]
MIKVLFFAQIRDQLATSELQMPSDENSNVQMLLTNLKTRDEKWNKVLSNARLMVAVNQTICNDNIDLSSGDEVAFFPPVTGG